MYAGVLRGDTARLLGAQYHSTKEQVQYIAGQILAENKGGGV